MKKFASTLLLLSAVFCTFNSWALDQISLVNNKEAVSRILTNKDKEKVVAWIVKHQLGYNDLFDQAKLSIKRTLHDLTKREALCDLGVSPLLLEHAQDLQIIKSDDEALLFFKYLRMQNFIDDIFLKMLIESYEINIESNRLRYPLRPMVVKTKDNKEVNIQEFFKNASQWPDDITACTFDLYFELVDKLDFKSPRDRDLQLKRLNYLGLKNNVISLSTYSKLETLRRRKVLDWPVEISGYFEILQNAKDKLAKEIEQTNKNKTKFMEKYVSRKEKLTRRASLYQRFTSTQIMLLAQILENTAKRMDAKRATLIFEYSEDPEGEVEVYVLAPMEQYRASLKFLRKEMAELQTSLMFAGNKFDYDDVIVAAFEAGIITSEQIDMIVKFEDFWNPKVPRWKTVVNLLFSVAGTGSLYLPPPFNIIASLALIVTQTTLMNKKKADPADNLNSIL